MTKIISIPFFLFFFFSACASDLVYCPKSADCKNGECTFESEANNYWSSIISPCDPERLLDGKYYATFVSAPYQLEDGGYAICVYMHSEKYQTLTIRARSSARLIIFEDEQSGWRHEESWGECYPNQADCPLQGSH